MKREAVLLAACLLNTAFMMPNVKRSWDRLGTTWSLSNPERRLISWGDLYRQILRLESTIPKQATIHLITSEYPWYLNYYLYPRTLFMSKAGFADREQIRRQYPSDWVLLFTAQNGEVHLDAFPPLKL